MRRRVQPARARGCDWVTHKGAIFLNSSNPGCSAVGSERAKMIDYYFREVISPKQGVGEASLRATINDYATARSAR